MDNLKKCLIIGAGDLGQRIAALMDKNGFQIYTLNRNITKLPTNYHRHTLDLGSKLMQLDLPIVFDHVFFSAAPDGHTLASYEKIYFQSLLQLKSILTKANHFYFCSSTGVYSQEDGEKITEDSPTLPKRFSGKVLVETENWIAENIPRHTIIRLSGLYSEERNRLFHRILDAQEIDYSKVSNRIHLHDAARLFVHIALLADKDKLYIGTDSSPSTYWEIAKWIAAQKGNNFDVKKPKQVSNRIILNQKIITSGFSFTYPTFKEGLKACL